MPKAVQDYFAAATRGDWITASNAHARFWNLCASPGLLQSRQTTEDLFRLRQPLIETFGAWEQYHNWDAKFLRLFGQEIIASIPVKSIYFGGTDPGRFLITTMSDSHLEGRPFFTVTQNALADGAYLDYLSDMYGERIYIPSTNDLTRCFEEYVKDAKARLQHDRDFPNEPHQIRPGEEVREVGGQVQVSGQVAVMAINALLVKVIFDRNPDREFYYEESYPLDWMYPHLTPHQFIFKLNRQPLKELSPETVRADREFWTRQMDSWLGAWLNTNTSIREVTDFVDRTFLKNDLKEFKGDQRFVRDPEARKAFSKLRCAIAGLYAWRATNSENAAEQQRMKSEADFAFRQAFAICPVSPETLARYVTLLLADGRKSDAVEFANAAYRLDPEHKQLGDLVQQLLRTKPPPKKAAPGK